MRNGKNAKIYANCACLCAVITLLSASSFCVGDYLKMNPPPDVDKPDHGHANKPTCYVAAASNLLAGAGYGDGNNVQERADEIYDEICFNKLCDCNNSGWDDTAMQKWLNSNFNTWKNSNPYTLIKNYNNRDGDNRYPYSRTDLPQLIGNELRESHFVSLSSSKVDCSNANVGKCGHSTAFWGDNGQDVNEINSNPTKLKISDSDYWDTSVAVQTYTYDDYNNPNPGECNEGKGWYFNYSNNDNHRYIDGYFTLEPNTGANPNPTVLTASAMFSYNSDPCALGLHYKISSNKQILSYRTSIDWDTNNLPSFTEDINKVSVYWNLNDNPVPKGTTITVTAEIVVPYDNLNGNSISIDGVWWTPVQVKPIPGGIFRGRHTEYPGGAGMSYIPNMCGGYVVCACMIFSNPSGAPPPVGEYRWMLDYDYYQDPCHHEITFEPNLAGPGGPYYAGYFRFGHSYGFLRDDELQTFSNWKTIVYPTPPFPPLSSRTFTLDWTGQLPYPRGQDLVNPVPQQCGDQGTWYVSGDINKDCKVDFLDFVEMAYTWLICTDPNQANCP